MTQGACDIYFGDVIEKMRETTEDLIIKLWFADAKVVPVDDNTVTLIAKDILHKNTIENRYADRLENAFHSVVGRRIRINYTYKNEVNEIENTIFTSAEVPEPKKSEAIPENVSKQTPDFSMYKDYTFESFVVGSSNRVAQSACYSVSVNPSMKINPLFIYGPSGLGKTHLLYATVNEARKNSKNFNFIYVTGEQFTNEIINAITSKCTFKFREKYRNVDMLLVDDIQFIAGKVIVQEEFFHTFDTLLKMSKQIILTSDKPPKEIAHLEDRLLTRFESGLIVDIQPPETELRAAIFKQKTMLMGLDISNEVLIYLAENIKSNVRKIEGAVKRLWAQSFITGEKITLEYAQSVLQDYIKDEVPNIEPEQIIKFLEKRYGFSREELFGKKRTSELVFVRHIAIYLIGESTGLSLKKIGKLFDRDHSTVISARDGVIKRMRIDPGFAKIVNDMLDELKTGK